MSSLTNTSSSTCSAGLLSACWPTVEAVPTVLVAEQNEPKPCVGKTSASCATSSTILRIECHCAWARPSVASGPIRSGRPTLP